MVIRDVAQEVRELVEANMLPSTPLGRALLGLADYVEMTDRALGVLTERCERLEEDSEAARPYTGGVHVLAPVPK